MILVRRWIAASLAVGGAVGAVLVARGPGRFTTYAGVSSVGTVLTVTVVLALVVSGVTLGRQADRRPRADLALVAALVWTAPTFAGWPAGPPLVPSLAAVLAGLAFPLVLQLALTQPERGSPIRWTRALIVGCYAEAALVAVTLALIRDPYLDPDCWANCGVNSFLVEPLPRLARAVQAADRWFVAAAAAVLCLGLLQGLLLRHHFERSFRPLDEIRENFRRLKLCYERSGEHFQAFHDIAARHRFAERSVSFVFDVLGAIGFSPFTDDVFL